MVEGVTFALQVPLPVPVAVVPSISVSVHAPVAVIVPDIVVLAPLQIEVGALVIAATGNAFTVTDSDPVRPVDIAEQLASVSVLIV